MRILEYRPIGGRDFHATMECEHCGGTQEIKTGYNDAYYHRHVIPAMTCLACGKNRAGEIPAESNAYGMKPVKPRTEPVVQELEQARADAARLRAALRLAEGPIAIAASYADQPCETMGMRVHAKDCARVLPEIHAALTGEGKAKRCTWTYDETHCAWDSSCGEKWVFMDDGPNENKIRFCHGCGKPVEIACEATPEKARQA